MPISPLAQAIALQNAVQPAQAPIQPADVLGAYRLSSDVAEKNYQAKLQSMMGLWGGLAALGGAGLIGGKNIWAPALSKALGVNSTAGTAAAAPAAATPAAVTDAAAAAEGSSGAVAPGIFDAASAPADWSIGDIAPSVAPTIAADYGLTGSGAGGIGALGGDAAGAAGSIAADLGAGAAAGGDAAAASIPEFLASFLPFLA